MKLSKRAIKFTHHCMHGWLARLHAPLRGQVPYRGFVAARALLSGYCQFWWQVEAVQS